MQELKDTMDRLVAQLAKLPETDRAQIITDNLNNMVMRLMPDRYFLLFLVSGEPTKRDDGSSAFWFQDATQVNNLPSGQNRQNIVTLLLALAESLAEKDRLEKSELDS